MTAAYIANTTNPNMKRTRRTYVAPAFLPVSISAVRILCGSGSTAGGSTTDYTDGADFTDYYYPARTQTPSLEMTSDFNAQ